LRTHTTSALPLVQISAQRRTCFDVGDDGGCSPATLLVDLEPERGELGVDTCTFADGLTVGEALAALALNIAQLASTLIWQRRLQAEMVETGYDEAKTKLLLATNWIRTAAFPVQALLATVIVVQALA